MIRSRYLVPKYLTSQSRDFHVLLRLLDLVVNSTKSKTDSFINILDPVKCPNNLLPLLSSYVGYKYDYSETYDRNRIIISNYIDMVRNRGSRTGIEMAIKTAISAENYQLSMFTEDLFEVAHYNIIYKCRECGYESFAYINNCASCGGQIDSKECSIIVATVSYPLYSDKLRSIMEIVRPIGSECLVLSGNIVNEKETVSITDYIKMQTNFYNMGRSDIGGSDALVGQAEIISSGYKYKECQMCGKIYKGEYVIKRNASGEDIKIKLDDLTSCSVCGSDKLLTESNSDIKLLYRLYNSNKELVSIRDTLLNQDMVNSEYNTTYPSIIKNIIGLVIRIHRYNYNKKTEKYEEPIVQSSLIGMIPYIDITGSDRDYTWSIRNILNRIEVANSNISKDNDSYYIIHTKESQLGDTTVIDNTKYILNTSDENLNLISILSRQNIGEIISDLNPHTYIKTINNIDTDEIKLHIGRDNGTSPEYEKDKSIYGEDDYYVPALTLDESETMVEHKGYMNICSSCNKYIEDEDFYGMCPYCGSEKIGDGTAYTRAQIPYSPNILRGSYVIDLHFYEDISKEDK